MVTATGGAPVVVVVVAAATVPPRGGQSWPRPQIHSGSHKEVTPTTMKNVEVAGIPGLAVVAAAVVMTARPPLNVFTTLQRAIFPHQVKNIPRFILNKLFVCRCA